jgi:large subunit ribosomal protein L4
MLVPIYDMKGEKTGDVELRPDIFEAPVSVSLMHQAFERQRANARLGTHKAQTRSEVARTTRKWYRQKGTGRARHGSRTANLFVGGGVAHGPKVRDYSKKMPRKMRQAALRAALSVKARDEEIVVVDTLEMDVPKTKRIVAALEALGAEGSVLLLLPGRDEIVKKSARNLPNVKVLDANYLNIRDLLLYDKVLITADSLQVIERILGR